MPSSKVVIDIIFIALVVVAASITAVVLAKVVANMFAGVYFSNSQVEQEQGDTALVITDPDKSDANQDPRPPADGGTVDFSRDSQLVAEPSGVDKVTSSLYGASPYILPITWGAVGGTLIWRGKVRSAWSRQGYDYDTFKLVAKMRGSPTRIRLLNAIGSPKNKLQLAKELDVDWKTVDNHIEMLMQSGLVQEKSVVGTAKYYMITENGTRVLSLLSSSETGGRN